MAAEIKWQDADSTSAKAVSQSFPMCKTMLCGGHSAKSHYTWLKGLARREKFTS